MQTESSPSIKVHDFVATALAHPRRLWVPVVVVLIASLCYALLTKPKWEAVQSLLVRNEATSGGSQLGKFEGLDAMKTAQETVMEIAKSRSVVAAALAGLRAESGAATAAEASPREIDETRARIKIKAPDGVEFGRSEVIRLSYTDTDRQRAIDFNRLLSLELQRHLQQLRDRKAESLIAELGESVELARADLIAATARLSRIEAEVGEDLAELRSLSEAASGTSNLRTRQAALENELRQAKLAYRESQQLLETLLDMQNDPHRLLATPATLLQSQPILQRLKVGLTEAQLRTAQLNGSMSDVHPTIIAARQSEAEVHARIRGELATAISGMKMELHLHELRAGALETQLNDVRQRMRRIAGLRAEYQNLVLQVGDRNEILQSAQQQLAAARSSEAAAHSTSMLTRINEPATGSYPTGPRRAYVVLAGLLGGLACGVGVVFLTAKAGAARRLVQGDVANRNGRAPANGPLHDAAHDAAEPSMADLVTAARPKLLGLPRRASAWRGAMARFSKWLPSEN